MRNDGGNKQDVIKFMNSCEMQLNNARGNMRALCIRNWKEAEREYTIYR